CRARARRATRSAAAATTPAARACQALAALHAPTLDDTCTECGHPWPCQTWRISSTATRRSRKTSGQQ
ncbi:hypothetical protein, partial [Actinomyces wuliandei]|uniref:hypothetical protein n=1 Tax=Actinomyces wuliandei TaxID=2057743 RepID=UPI001C57DDA2